MTRELVRRTWGWLTTHVIDLRKAAAGYSTAAVALLAYFAVDNGIEQPLSWLMLVAAVALVPVVWLSWLALAHADEVPRTPLPPIDTEPGPEPPSHVRRLD